MDGAGLPSSPPTGQHRRPPPRSSKPLRSVRATASLTAVDRLSYGLTSQPWAVLFALLAAWTGLIVALWAAFFGFFLGIFVAIGAIAANSLTRQLFNSGAGQAVGAVGVVSGAVVGAGGSFVAVYAHVLFGNPFYVAVSMAAGLALGCLILGIVSGFEGDVLRWTRGYRHLTKDETRRIAPLLKQVGDSMRLADTPKLAMADLKIPSAWAHMRHVVLTTALLDVLSDDELMAVLAHELHHWNRGHAVGLTFVAACAWPVTLLYNFAAFIGGYRLGEGEGARPGSNFGSIIVWFLFWPAWVLAKLLIGPAVAARSRRHEYEADAASAAIGFGPSLASALCKLSAFEGGRTGWEAVTSSAHPPTALRLDKLQPAQSDDEDYVDAPLGGFTSDRARAAAYVFAVVVACVIAGGAILNHVQAADRVLGGYPQTPTGAEQAGMKFTAQFFDDGSNEAAVRTLVSNNAPTSNVNGLMTEYQTIAAGFNTAVASGYHPVVTAVANGCNVVMSSSKNDAEVDLNEHWTLQVQGLAPLNQQLATVMHLEWLSGRWQVDGLATRPLGTAGWPTSFGACP